MVDFEKLLAPISDASPTGSNLRYVDGDLTFQQVEENRTEEDPALAVEGEGKSANWKAVVRLCDEALATKSKDLQLVAWLCEGLAHTEGFAGVRDGLRLTKEILFAFWDRLHPGFEEGEIILPIRAKPLAWLASPRCFLPAVKAVPIATGYSERPLTWRDREISEIVDDAQTHSDQSQFEEMKKSGAVTGEAWRTALSNTPLEKLQETLANVNECSAELQELRKLCEERFGDDAPTLTPLDDLFVEIRDALQRSVGTGEEAAEGEEGEGIEVGAAAGARVSGPIGSRRQALQQLSQVAAFFRQTEPHSPISYLVQRAVRWGDMPLEDLLKEVVKSNDALEHIWETLGIRREGEGQES
jgi:type VI secretion system protein ImpA